MKMTSMSPQQVKEMFLYVGDQIIESKPLLTEVDSAIGDGDHGIGMSVGFTEAKANLEKQDFETINDVFKTIGMSMISSMGGASGVIFGTLFVGGIKNLDKSDTLDVALMASIFEKSLQAIKDRGKANIGDKTMIDSLEPAVEGLRECAANGEEDILASLKVAEEKANEGVEKSKEYVAKFGRAKSLGDRAIGHQDAGATSIWIIFKSMREWIEDSVANE